MDDRDRSAAIQQQMAMIREELHDDVEHVVEQARDLVDWRRFVSRHPWLTVGASIAVGYLAVPSKRQAMRPDSETIAQLARDHRFVIKADASNERKSSLLKPIATFVGSAIVRSVVSMAGQKIGQIMNSDDMAAPPSEDVAAWNNGDAQ